MLEELYLQGCKELTDYSLEILVKHQPGLLKLDISGCTELTSRSVEAVARGLRSLTHLSLSRDWRITEKGLSADQTRLKANSCSKTVIPFFAVQSACHIDKYIKQVE